jgi:hypothetical protein
MLTPNQLVMNLPHSSWGATLRTSILRVLTISTLFIFGLTSRSLAQFETAAVLGTVLNAQVRVVQNAHLSLLNLGAGKAQETTTSADGTYQILKVRVGNYKVTAESAGFKKSETPECRVDVGVRQRVDIRLVIGDLD